MTAVGRLLVNTVKQSDRKLIKKLFYLYLKQLQILKHFKMQINTIDMFLLL